MYKHILNITLTFCYVNISKQSVIFFILTIDKTNEMLYYICEQNKLLGGEK